jgi:hypothetical protein
LYGHCCPVDLGHPQHALVLRLGRLGAQIRRAIGDGRRRLGLVAQEPVSRCGSEAISGSSRSARSSSVSASSWAAHGIEEDATVGHVFAKLLEQAVQPFAR